MCSFFIKYFPTPVTPETENQVSEDKTEDWQAGWN